MKFKSPESFHQRISLLFHLIIALPLVVFIYLFLEMKHNDLKPLVNSVALEHVINTGFTILAAFFIVYAYNTYSGKLEGIRKLPGLVNKIEHYYSLFQRLYLLVGLSSFLVVSGLYLTTSPLFIVEYVLLLFLLSLHRPTPKKYVNDLRLKDEEKEVILSKGEFPL